VNRLLLLANVTIFVIYWLSSQSPFLDARFALEIDRNFVMLPGEIVQGQRLFTLFTSMFMHANWIHLIGNMLYLYVFGDNIEDVLGHVGYLAFYIFCGLAAAFSHIASITTSADLFSGVVGASGAISGVLGAYAVLYPKARVLTLITYVIVPIPAILLLGFWFVMQWLSVTFNVSGGVAYWAHIGGFITGVVLAFAFGLGRKKKREAEQKL
jgi:membrane associated rhomboid family serine protease